MPNTPVWGQQDAIPAVMEDQDLISAEESGSVIKVNDVADDDPDHPAIHAINSEADGRALKAEGTAEVDGDLMVSGSINADTVGHDCVVGDNSNETHLGQANHPTHVLGNLQVAQAFAVGLTNGPGSIDARGNPVAQNLNIGANAATADVNLGRAGQDVNVADDLNVGGDCAVVGELHVGPEADAGMVDSGGDVAIPQDLKVGTGIGTEDVQIGRAGQTLDIFAQARANGNSVILNNAANITAGTGCGLL